MPRAWLAKGDNVQYNFLLLDVARSMYYHVTGMRLHWPWRTGGRLPCASTIYTVTLTFQSASATLRISLPTVLPLRLHDEGGGVVSSVLDVASSA